MFASKLFTLYTLKPFDGPTPMSTCALTCVPIGKTGNQFIPATSYDARMPNY